MKKRIGLLSILFIGIIVSVWAYTATSTEPQAETPPYKIIRWNLGSEPSTLDPQLNSDLYGGSIINHMYEGLLRYENDILTPAVAESYDVSEDGTIYTFRLRETQWSDGTPVTAQDFEYAWKRALNPRTASEFAYHFFYIKGAEAYHKSLGTSRDVGVKALDDTTLEVVLNAPTPQFLDLLATFTYFPVKKPVINKGIFVDQSMDPNQVISNGPFKLTDHVRGEKIILKKSPTYWHADQIKIDEIQIAMVVDSSTTLTGFEEGSFDVIDSVPLAEIPKLMAESNSFKMIPSVATAYYIFNVDKKPLDDPNVRKALSYAVNRVLLVDAITKAGEIPATGMTPPGLKDASGNDFRKTSGHFDFKHNEMDVKKAKEYLASAGYPDGKDFPELELIYNTSETNDNLAAAIQQMWKENLNIDVHLSNQEYGVFQSTKNEGNFHIARGSWFGDYPDPLAMLEIWTSDNNVNTSGWHNTTYDHLIEKARTTLGQEHFDHLYQAEQILMEEMPIIPLYYYSDVFMVAEHITGYEKSPMGIWYFGNADIKENEL